LPALLLKNLTVASGLLVAGAAMPAFADTLLFSTGNPDGKMATASRPSSAGKIEIESADDFILSTSARISSATFTGLITGASPTIGEVRVEIYRVFPGDSTTPPSGNVPTRVNSPSDVEFADRDTASGNLTFSTTTLVSSFTVANTVLNGINKVPNQTTGGEGAVTGTEVAFTVNFTTPFLLPGDHYFFVPQVEVAGGEFLWLSAPKPIVAPGTPFAPDLQEWIRNENLAPDWLRVGTDIVGSGAFNATFSLTGAAIPAPEPASLAIFGVGLGAIALGRRRTR